MLKISEFRKEKGLTQTELANNLGISVKKLGAWEQCRAEPYVDDLIMLANFFDYTLDELMGRTTDDKPANSKGLTPQEYALITAYRKLNEKERLQAINIISALCLDD